MTVTCNRCGAEECICGDFAFEQFVETELASQQRDSDRGDFATPCPECSATGQHYAICSQE